MIVTTTPSIKGKTILDYKGIVTGETIIGANIFKDFLRNPGYRRRAFWLARESIAGS
jgi:uncharacterized protein YbjQ (UPF0145 family)